MDFRDMVRTVSRLARGEAAFWAGVEGASAVRPAGLDETGFASFVETYRLTPGMAAGIEGGEAARLFSPSTVERLFASLSMCRARIEQVVADSLEVEKAMRAKGIRCLHLKGPSFGQRFHGGAERRYQRDVDLLVRPQDRVGAFEVMETLGFVRELVVMDRGVVRLGFARGSSAVDVHWGLRRRARRRVLEDNLWKETASFSLRGETLSTLSDDATLLFLLLSICGDVRRGAATVRAFLDLDRILRTWGPAFSLEAFLERRRAQSLERPCVNVLALHLALWGAEDAAPGVAEAVGARRRLVAVRDDTEALDLFLRPKGDAANRRWFRRAYPFDEWGRWAHGLTLDLPRTLSSLARGRREAPLGAAPRP